MFKLAYILVACLLLTGCISQYENNPSPTADEQMLTTHASERLASELNLKLEKDTKVYLNTDFIDKNANNNFLIAAIRAHLIGRGLVLVTQDKADTIIELRVSADSINDLNRVIGFPGTTFPTSTNYGSVPVNIPEIAIYSKHTRFGVVELYAVAYDSKTGKLQSAVGPEWVVSKLINRRYFTSFVFGPLQEQPGIITKDNKVK